MDRLGVLVEILDASAAVLIAPEVAGAKRPEDLRASFIKNAGKPVDTVAG